MKSVKPTTHIGQSVTRTVLGARGGLPCTGPASAWLMSDAVRLFARRG
jgi:hypothetical protein